jgi:hypothetical protein
MELSHIRRVDPAHQPAELAADDFQSFSAIRRKRLTPPPQGICYLSIGGRVMWEFTGPGQWGFGW